MKPGSVHSAALAALFSLACLAPARAAGEAKQLTGEHLGELSCGEKSEAVTKALGEPDSKGKLEHEEAGGTWMQSWTYTDKKVKLEMQALKKGGPLKVACIITTKGCKLATTKSISLGDSEEKALTTYKEFIDKGESEPGKSIVAFTPDGCLRLEIESHKVTSIYLGLLAE